MKSVQCGMQNVKHRVWILLVECGACHVASCCYSVCLIGWFRLGDCPVYRVECSRLQSAE